MKSNFNITILNSEEQEANSRTLKFFTYAFTAYDVKSIEELLHPKGVFFGKYSRTRAAGIFYTFFFGADGIHELHSMSINRGWSVYPLPGSEVIEIRCSNCDPFSGNSSRKKLGEPEDKQLGEKVFRFCFEFRDEQIYRIEVSRRYVSQDADVCKNN
jgi:hypothetical protein